MYKYNLDMYIGCSVLFSGFCLLCTLVYLYFNRQFKEIFSTFFYTLFVSFLILIVLSPVLFFTMAQMLAGAEGDVFINILFGFTFFYFLIVFTVMGYYLNKYFKSATWTFRIILSIFVISCWYIIPFAPILSFFYK